MVSTGKHFEFDEGLFPTSDPSIWNLDEDDDVLTFNDLYIGIEAQQDLTSSNIPKLNNPLQSSTPMLNNYHMQFPDIKQQFPLTNNHTTSMPVLPTPNQPLNFYEMNQVASRPNVSIQQEVPKPNYSQLSHYPSSNSLQHPAVQTVPTCEKPISQYSPTTESAMVTFVDLNPFYEKGQCRLQGKSEQRLDYAISFVRIYLAKPNNIKAKAAYVERAPDAAHILKDSVGRVPLKILPDESDSWMKVNLDDAGSEVYKLSKVKGEERNRFRIVVELLFSDTNQRKLYYSDTFQVKSKPKSTDQLIGDSMFEEGDKPVKFDSDLKQKPIKRQRVDELDCTTSLSPTSVGSSVFPEVITDHLRATTAEIDQLKILQPIQTQRGDIAYNFKLNGCPPDLVLEEGDVIGFFENSFGKTEIRPLSCENVQEAKLAGVISRSAWLEGKTPEDADRKDETDLVCVSGIVKVKIRGPVQNGERIYASLSSYPGVAMPENVITQVTSNELTMLGQALESKDGPPDKVNLVSCFVSIFLGIQTKHTAKVVNEVRSGVMADVHSKVQTEKKKLLRGLRWKVLALFIFCGLLAVLLYQLYAPLTAYRYWKCRQGSISGSTSAFTFITSSKQIPRVNGVEFHFEELMDKLDFSRNTKRKKDGIRSMGFRYYLNIDRCAAGGLIAGVYGPKFYVMNDECSATFYLYGPYGYEKYKSGSDFECSFTPMCSVCPAVYRNPSRLKKKLRKRYKNCSRGIERNDENPRYAFFRYTSSKDFQITAAEAVETSVTNNSLSQDYNNLDDQLHTRNIDHEKICIFKRPSNVVYYIEIDEIAVLTVTGVQVDLDFLRRRQNTSISEFVNKTEVRYFYNLDHCVWQDQLRGPDFFAVADKCDNAHYHSTKSNNWYKYRSSKEYKCLPPFQS